MSEHNAPERIWAVPAIGGGWADNNVFAATIPIKSPSAIEYTRSDLMPRWRPIAELDEGWKDGRDLIVRFDGTSAAMCWADVDWHGLDRVTEFLDFGGKSMPD